jgi:hypothetical protein
LNPRHRPREHPGVTSTGRLVAAGEKNDVDHRATMGHRGQGVQGTGTPPQRRPFSRTVRVVPIETHAAGPAGPFRSAPS